MSEEQAPAINDRQMQILADEMSRLQTMYLDARNNAQSVFNFYLSFLTAVIGGIVFLVQIQPEGEAGRAEGLVVALLFFAAMVGSVYMGALSGRYGHAARFARALDGLRREAIRSTQTPLPRLYDAFLSESDADTRPPPEAWYIWLVPTGSYPDVHGLRQQRLAGLNGRDDWQCRRCWRRGCGCGGGDRLPRY